MIIRGRGSMNRARTIAGRIYPPPTKNRIKGFNDIRHTNDDIREKFLTEKVKYGKFSLVPFYLLLGDMFNETKNSFSL